ncbi:conserved protein of unknown function [Burkholderia multivorans]
MRDLNMIERKTVSGGWLVIGGGLNGTDVVINYGKPGDGSNGGKGGNGIGVNLPGNGSSWLSKFFK